MSSNLTSAPKEEWQSGLLQQFTKLSKHLVSVGSNPTSSAKFLTNNESERGPTPVNVGMTVMVPELQANAG